jgi:hypothetical protein
MATALLPDPLWDLLEPLLPIPPRRPRGGRPRVSDRACLTGIVFVLRSGFQLLFIGSRLCSTLLSDLASRLGPCASLSLHVHHVVKRTCTSKLSIMLGTPKKESASGESALPKLVLLFTLR